eukprot:scaffold13975_cov69-Cyclotella_meneghiniana.AAC.16
MEFPGKARFSEVFSHGLEESWLEARFLQHQGCASIDHFIQITAVEQFVRKYGLTDSYESSRSTSHSGWDWCLKSDVRC